ncbi:hypothetical protein, partial [Sphingomonas sp.]|uniref:hypothetical protein n=1 Tax=Sphingomonas sp. TaxID=28214 RepID=UPI003B3AB16F
EERYCINLHGKTSEVLLPTSTDIKDYNRRVASLFYDLEQILEMEVDQIYRNLEALSYDVVRIRAHEGRHIGSLQFGEAVDLLENGFELIASAATTAVLERPRSILRGRRPDEVRDYLDRVRMGQTEIGSFVLTLLLPVAPNLNAPALSPEDSTTFGRKVSQRLDSALSASHEAAKVARVQGASVFLEAVEKGVTANFCSALAAMLKTAGDLTLRIDHGVNSASTSSQRKFSFIREDVSVLSDAASALSDRPNDEPAILSGTITTLREASLRKPGSLTLQTYIEGESHAVRIPFSRAERETVIEAFRSKIECTLEVRGSLSRKGSHYSLLNPHDFKIVKFGQD